jgi:hypothetical protein
MSRSGRPHPVFERLAQRASLAWRSARQGPEGRRLLPEAGAAPTPPFGVAPPKASAVATLLSRPGKLPPARTVVATVLAVCLLAVPASAGPMEDRAKAAADAARSKSADSQALQQNYVTPGLAGQPIASVDGSTSFTPNIACQKSATFMEVLVQPVASGDLGKVQIGRDMDLDGVIDATINLPIPVSGICSNGVISCQPGSWAQCHYFRWDVDAARALTLTEVEMPALAGCYCLNNSCGTNLAWSNMSSVLTDLGGGMVGALTSNDARIGVSQAVINGPTIRYVGAQATACAADPSLPQTGYRANPATMVGDAAGAAGSSKLFEILSSSPIGTGTVQETRACAIERQIIVDGVTSDDVISRVAGGYATIVSPGSVDFLLGSPKDDALDGGSCRLFDFRMTLHVDKPDRILSAMLSTVFFDDWIQLRIDGKLVYADPGSWTSLGLPPSGCERGRTWYAFPGTDLEIWLRVAVGGQGEASAQIHVDVDESCKTIEQIIDTCGALAANPKCKIAGETVDGVETFRNGIKTGLNPLPQTRIFGTMTCPLEVTRDFFKKDRSYKCEIDTGTLPTPDTSRGAYIIDHSTETLLADRIKRADGSYAETSRGFALPDRGSVAACEPICKTRAPRDNVGAAPAGVVGSQQNSPSGYDTFYHACSTESVCPLGPGEALVSGCGCLDDFPEAVVMMQTVRLAGADLVCTDTAR